MFLTKCCPICGEANLKTRKRYSFAKPEQELTRASTYQDQRLSVLFGSILQNQDKVEMFIDQCRGCNLLFLNPRYSREEITLKYEALSMLINGKGEALERKIYRADDRSRRVYELIENITREELINKKILDYGGAEGKVLRSFIKHNDCFLVDYIQHDLAEGITYLGGEDSIREDEQYDIILICHVLEHNPDPLGLIVTLTRHLSEEGIIYIEVPVGVMREWRVLGEPLTHINFFSEEAIYNCVRRAGLNVYYIESKMQWVTESRMWCINVICGKSSENKKFSVNRPRNIKTTRQQTINPIMYLLMVAEKISRPIIINKARKHMDKQITISTSSAFTRSKSKPKGPS